MRLQGRPRLAAFWGFALLAVLSGCGGGVPLLHTAHVLPPGRTSFGAGVSDRFVLGAERHALDAAQQRPAESPAPPANDQSYSRGVLVALAEGPAVAPWAAARVGIAGSNEAGLSYSGQALRLDARHAFEWDQTAFSAGVGLTGRGFGESPLDLPGADLSRANGFGVDVPLLFGVRSDADLLAVWGGARFGYDHWAGKIALDQQDRFTLSAGRVSAGPVLGLAVGVTPFWVAAELELDYAHVTGTLDRPGNRYDAQLSGWSVHPAGALIAKF
jgi:hypothetical protein